MIEKLFKHPYLLHQTADGDVDMSNAPIAGYIDNGGTIDLSQKALVFVSNALASRSCAS